MCVCSLSYHLKVSCTKVLNRELPLPKTMTVTDFTNHGQHVQSSDLHLQVLPNLQTTTTAYMARIPVRRAPHLRHSTHYPDMGMWWSNGRYRRTEKWPLSRLSAVLQPCEQPISLVGGPLGGNFFLRSRNFSLVLSGFWRILEQFRIVNISWFLNSLKLYPFTCVSHRRERECHHTSNVQCLIVTW